LQLNSSQTQHQRTTVSKKKATIVSIIIIYKKKANSKWEDESFIDTKSLYIKSESERVRVKQIKK